MIKILIIPVSKIITLNVIENLEFMPDKKVIVQKTKADTYRGTDYYKYRVNIPIDIVRELGIDAGTEMRVTTHKNSIIFTKI